MATYKNSELYQLAFNLAIKVYKLNVMLPLSGLLHQGSRLRWISLQIKDMISESYASNSDAKKQLRNLNQTDKLIQDLLISLKKIGAVNASNKQIPILMSDYMLLSRKVKEQSNLLQPYYSEYIIPFTENRVMDMAG